MHRVRKQENRSLRGIWTRLSVIMLVIWLIFTAACVAALHSLEHRNHRNMQGLLEVGASQIESRMEQMEDYIKGVLVSNTELNALRNSNLNRVSNLRQFALRMESDGKYFSEFSGIFFYDANRDILLDKQWNDLSIYSYFNTKRKMTLRERIVELTQDEGTHNSWKIVDVQNVWSAFYVYAYEGQYLGIYISLDGILDRITELNVVEGFADIYLADQNGTRLTQETESVAGNSREDIRLMRELEHLQLTLHAVPEDEGIHIGQILIWVGCFLLAVSSGLLMLFILWMLQRSLFAPLSELNRQMKYFSEGKLDTCITEQSGCREVQDVIRTFNGMTVEIREMKIENYEKQLENQETILKYFQIQKNPHFFLNVLNGIYSLAASGNMIQVRKITLELIKHVRYILSVEKLWVPLAEELEFTKNYLEIQRIRFPYEIRLETEGFTEACGKVQVPTLILQTFVENAVKYALSPENLLAIRLAANLESDHLELTISDSGPGFSEKILEELQAYGKISPDERGEHIGIYNILSRMKLLYKDSCEYQFCNLPSGGAQVRLILPL